MIYKFTNKTYLGLVFLTLICVFGGFTPLVSANSIPENSSRLQVTGNSVITAVPDTALILLGVETNASSAELAAQDNALVMEKVMAHLEELGLADHEISTNSYNIYSYNQIINRGKDNETTVLTYTVQNRIEIKTDQLDQVGRIVDTAIRGGANQVQGIRFDLGDKEELYLKALKNATKQARVKASAVAEAAEIEIGGLVMITEEYGTYAPTNDMVIRAQAMGSAETSIKPGEIEISAKVDMIFWF